MKYTPLLIILALLIVSCNESENKTPIVSILSPSDGEIFYIDDTVQIKAEAFDDDGTIDSLKLIINGQEKFLVNESNIEYFWDTTNDTIGEYVISIFATDNENLNVSSQITITLKDSALIRTSTMSDDRDGKIYNTVRIADVWWLAENLMYNSENSVFYQNDSNAYHIYGKLYSYEEALNTCPSGWALATDQDWKSLEKAMGMSDKDVISEGWRGSTIATKLKVNGKSKFEAKLGGYYSNGNFADIGLGYWWTSSKDNDTNIWFRSMSDYYDTVERNSYPDSYKFSIRCVKE